MLERIKQILDCSYKCDVTQVPHSLSDAPLPIATSAKSATLPVDNKQPADKRVLCQSANRAGFGRDSFRQPSWPTFTFRSKPVTKFPDSAVRSLLLECWCALCSNKVPFLTSSHVQWHHTGGARHPAGGLQPSLGALFRRRPWRSALVSRLPGLQCSVSISVKPVDKVRYNHAQF